MLTAELIYELVNNKHLTIHSHYFNRYIKFYFLFKELNSNNFDADLINHHFLPKAKDAFPEYTSFTDYPWNKLRLTRRQHIFAHLLLYKSFPELKSQIYALNQLKGLIDNRLSPKLLKVLKSNLRDCLAEDVSTKRLKRKTKPVYNKFSGEYYRIPIDQELLACESIKNKPIPSKPEYIQKYHDPVTNIEYWVDIRYPIDKNLVKGRTPKFKAAVKGKSKGNVSNLNKFKYYHPETLKEYHLYKTDIRISELNLVKGRSPKSNANSKKVVETHGLNKGDKNPMFGKIRSDQWPIIKLLDINGVETIIQQPAKDQYKQYPKKFRNVGILTFDKLKELSPKKYKKYLYLVDKSIIYNGSIKIKRYKWQN